MSNVDIIFHFGELHTSLGSDWKNYFPKDTIEVTLPKGNARNFEAYEKAIKGFNGFGASAYTKGSDGKLQWHPITSLLKARGYTNALARVAVMGFSETCIGAAVLLGSADAGGIDFAFGCDGIHASQTLINWKKYARLAATNRGNNPNIPPTDRMCVVTHSETPGSPGVQSTTEAAKQIIDFVRTSPIIEEPIDIPELTTDTHDPISTRCHYSGEKYTYTYLPNWYHVKMGGLWILGYENLAKTCNDHIYQSKVILPRVLKHMLVPRWRDNPHTGGTCVVI